MTKQLEDGRQMYSSYFRELEFGARIIDHFFDVRDNCYEELIGMRKLVERIKPTPIYTIYGRGVPLLGNKYLYHSDIADTLAGAFKLMYKENGRFSVDGNSRIVLAGSNVRAPRVEVYTPVIVTSDVYRLPINHSGVALFSLAERLTDKVINAPSSSEFFMLLLGEGFNDNMDNLMHAILKT